MQGSAALVAWVSAWSLLIYPLQWCWHLPRPSWLPSWLPWTAIADSTGPPAADAHSWLPWTVEGSAPAPKTLHAEMDTVVRFIDFIPHSLIKIDSPVMLLVAVVVAIALMRTVCSIIVYFWKVRLAQTFCQSPDPKRIHMLVCGIDYKQTSVPLSCTADAKNIEALAKACGVTNLHMMMETECTRSAITSQLKRFGKKCCDGDTFIFYFSGHGLSVKDVDLDEADGNDEAFVCYFKAEFSRAKHLLVDDDFALILTENFHMGTHILVLVDCCHSGSICDFTRSCWAGRQACSISGCRDEQKSEDIGRGGYMTHSLLNAIEHLQQDRERVKSVGQAYDAIIHSSRSGTLREIRSPQHITLKSTSSCSPYRISWPLNPTVAYTSPMNRVCKVSKGEILKTKGVQDSEVQDSCVAECDLVHAAMTKLLHLW